MTTASMITTPRMIFCQNSETPHMVMPSLMTPMTNAPTMVPTMVPEPPAMDVPPRTVAAMAFISQPSPEAGCAADSCAVLIRPIHAAQKPEMM